MNDRLARQNQLSPARQLFSPRTRSTQNQSSEPGPLAGTASTKRRATRRILIWVVVGVLVAAFGIATAFLVLLLKTPAPIVFKTDPSAVQRLANEMREAHAAALAGIPHTVYLDEA